MANEITSRRALSRQGHAAISMKGGSDKWIQIQKTTFTNWVNEQLKEKNLGIEDLHTDLGDGVNLCALVSCLQERKIGRVIQKPMNQHHMLENVQIALNAIADDNIRLVNIGSEDIVNGNLKLILGLIWHLILRYQIGKHKFPPKKLMLAWLQAVIPRCHIGNFTTDWNDGIALHALIEYCKPGLAPNWESLNSSDRLQNCQHAMGIAKQEFGIPLVVRPEDMSSPDLDDLSGMTYLSYYMNVDSPGYNATLNQVRGIMTHGTVDNFTTDWNDGTVLCYLCSSLGEDAPTCNDNVTNLERGIDAGRRLGVDPILNAQEMSEAQEEHLGIMAYAAKLSKLQPVERVGDQVTIDTNLTEVYVGKMKNFDIGAVDGVNTSDVRAEVIGPDSLPPVQFYWLGMAGQASFTPSETGHHRLNVYHLNKPLTSCPVNFQVASDRNQVTFGHSDKVAAGRMTEFTVDTSSAGQGDVRVEARAPISGKTQNLNAVYRNGAYSTNFLPDEPGNWMVSVVYDGDHIQGSPYVVNVFDPAKVRVYGLEDGSVGKELGFFADCSESGDGDFRVNILNEGGSIGSSVNRENSTNYRCDFIPRGPGDYKIHAYLNDVEIKGSPFNCHIVDSSMVSASGDGLSLVPVSKTAFFEVQTQGASGKNVSVEITGPDNTQIPCRVKTDGDMVRADYMPTAIGNHRIVVLYGEKEVTGSPFTVKSYDTSAIEVSPLSDAIVGEEIHFIIDVSKAGEGQLEIMVNNGDLPNTVEGLRTGVYKVGFVPVSPGRQFVDIKFNAEAAEGSPFYCNAIDTGRTEILNMETRMTCMQLSSFKIHSDADSSSDLRAVVDIISPSGEQVSARIIPEPDGDYRVDWTPTVAGTYTLDVTFAGRAIQGSPFYVNVFDAHRVKVYNIRGGLVEEQAGLTFDTREAGDAEHQVMIISPSGQVVQYEAIEQNGERTITYNPQEAGKYMIHLTYGGLNIPGSPFTQEIGDLAIPLADGEGLHKGEEDRTASFTILSAGIRGKPSVTVDGPNSIAKVQIDENSNGSYNVSYVPVEVGIFDIRIRWNDKDIPGSPYYPTVVDQRKVRIVGGWQSYMDTNERILLEVDKERSLAFDVADAGPGKLTCEVKGPHSTVPSYVEEKISGQSVVSFTPREEGIHYIHLFWSDHPLPKSPFIGDAQYPLPDVTKVILSGKGLREATIRQKAEFLIDGSQAGPGSPDVRLSGVKADVHVNCVPLGGGKYRCSYMPIIPGAYLLHISWNDRQLRGSPYKINIISACNPEKVVLEGDGLRGGVLGKELDVIIDTKKAGPGELTAHCMGPHEVAYSSLEDLHDGTYRLRIIPKEAGRHVLQVKYGGEHVLGSPYIIKITQQSDASKVRVSGPGVEHGILHTYQSRFIVETRGAGPGQLTVRIRGPKGAFNVEMHRESQKDRTILCRYSPHEIGLYQCSVKWSNVDVPGSPFQVYIVDTQDDLEKVLQDAAYGRLANTSFSSHQSSFNNGYTNYNSWSRDEV